MTWCAFVGKAYGLSNGVMTGASTGKVRCPKCGKLVAPRKNGNGTFLGLPRHKEPVKA